MKIAYEGRGFKGSQRQPRVRTVEGEVLRALKEIEAIGSVEEARFATASRTDKGVNALGNVIAFDTAFVKGELLGALNAVSPSVHFYALAQVPSTFNVRRARERWYRYLLSGEGLDYLRVKEAGALFEGRHDFRNFCKVDVRETVKTLREVKTLRAGKFMVIDFRAQDFLWNMIRRMVAAMEEVGKKKAALDEVKASLMNKEPRTFGLAPPERLTLMDVEYEFDFTHQCPPTLMEKVVEAEERSFFRLLFHRELLDLCEHPEGEAKFLL